MGFTGRNRSPTAAGAVRSRKGMTSGAGHLARGFDIFEVQVIKQVPESQAR